ncbi:MAG: AraC family transcriptional regulator [Microthrixaceae bacterium]
MDRPDRLDALLGHFRVRTRLFHAGPLCGTTNFPAQPGQGHLHVLRRGRLEMDHRDVDGSRNHRQIDRPSLVFYPRPLEHAFFNTPADESDFVCATLDVDGGPTHPLLDALPPVIVLPLDTAAPLAPTLDLLFAEIDRVRCGRLALADRLFEILLIQLFRWLLDHPHDVTLPAGLVAGLADERLARALTAIHESPGEPWTLATMADAAGMSRSSFAAHFKQRIGQTPAVYLARWRVTLAQAQLRAGVSVTRTATDLGYSTTPAFSRAFTAHIGCSPRAWLATARQADLMGPTDSGGPADTRR